MPIYTNDPCDDGLFPMWPSLRSSIGIGPKVTKAIDAATKDWLDEHPEATTTVEDDSLTNAKFMDGSVDSRVIEDESIITDDIADLAITTPKIADNAVTADKVASSAADGLRTMSMAQPGVAKVGAGLAMNNGALELNGGNIAPAVTAWLDAHPEATTTVQDGVITNAKIANGAVTDDKLVQTGGILGQVDYLSNHFDAGYKRMTGASVDSSGVVVAADAIYDLVCFQITGRDMLRNLTSPDALIYAFFTEEPFLGSISYNNSRTTFTNIGTVREVAVPSGVSWIAVRIITGHASPTIVPVIPEIDALLESLDASRVGSQALSYKIGQYGVPQVGYMPPYVSTTNIRFCSESYFLIKKGQTFSVNHSPLSVQLLFCDRDGYYLGQYMNYGKSYTATEDVYAYAVFKDDSGVMFTDVIDMYAYFPILYYANDSKWSGKTWYSFGTSMSDINPDGVTGNNGTKGKWPLVVDEFSGMTRTNKAIGGGGIVPSATHGGNVKNNIMQCPYDVDLVTFECGLNDWGAVTLGEVGDKSNDSFIGNFTQCIEHLTYNTRARIVFISMTPLVFTDYSARTRRDVFFKNSFGYTYRQYIDAMIEVCHSYGVTVIDVQANAMSNGRLNEYTIVDTTHYSDLGGAMSGRYIWSKLNDILPMPKFPSE